jgi:hypothetical protein
MLGESNPTIFKYFNLSIRHVGRVLSIGYL